MVLSLQSIMSNACTQSTVFSVFYTALGLVLQKDSSTAAFGGNFIAATGMLIQPLCSQPPLLFFLGGGGGGGQNNPT